MSLIPWVKVYFQMMLKDPDTIRPLIPLSYTVSDLPSPFPFRSLLYFFPFSICPHLLPSFFPISPSFSLFSCFTAFIRSIVIRVVWNPPQKQILGSLTSFLGLHKPTQVCYLQPTRFYCPLHCTVMLG